MVAGHQKNVEYNFNFMTQFQIECLKEQNISPTNHFASFSIGPLDPGQGITLGNCLRRTLLSELKASAIVTARISGVQHEFSTLVGVREDILEILLNLKEIVFKGYTANLATAFLKIKGPCIITAQDLQIPPFLKILNPYQYIATLSEDIIFEMQLGIRTGKGYNLVENQLTDEYVDSLAIDAIFMPVRRVSYNIETLTIPEDQIREHLIIDILTNGSISPKEGLMKASEQLISLLSPFLNTQSSKVKLMEEKNNFENVKIEDLNLSARSYNCLKRASINTVQDLITYPAEKLRSLKNLGQKSLEEIDEVLIKQFSVSLVFD